MTDTGLPVMTDEIRWQGQPLPVERPMPLPGTAGEALALLEPAELVARIRDLENTQHVLRQMISELMETVHQQTQTIARLRLSRP